MRIGVGIATVGRAGVLREAIEELRQQTRPADRVIVCGASPDDVAGIDAEVIMGPRG